MPTRRESKIMQGRTSEPSKSQARCKDFPDGWLGLGEQANTACLVGGRERRKNDRARSFAPSGLAATAMGGPPRKII